MKSAIIENGKDEIRVSRILHAGYLLEAKHTRILMDPIFENPFSVNCYAFPDCDFDLVKIKAQKVDAVFISHVHEDHFSLKSLNLISRETSIYIYCFDELYLRLLEEMGFQNLFQMSLKSKVSVGPFRMRILEALEPEIDSIFHIECFGLQILNVVDSWISEVAMAEIQKVQNWDLVIWPFQAMREVNILSPHRFPAENPEVPWEWLEQLKRINPKNLVPSSCQFRHEEWSWYNTLMFPISYKMFAQKLQEVLTAVRWVRLEPSRTYLLSEHSFVAEGNLDWVILKELRTVDYDFDPKTSVPSLTEVAKFFPTINKDEESSLLEFLQSEIIERYRKLKELEASYFAKARIWELRIFNSDKIPQSFFYSIQGQSMKALVERRDTEWLTEICAYKLYQALNSGESLTSLYLRINDEFFSQETEADLTDIDFLQDPLIRCLYEGQAGLYQRHQLLELVPKSRLGWGLDG
jgi:hypothetical protein